MKRGDLISKNKEKNTVTIYCPQSHGRSESKPISIEFNKV